jgi:hypothetical protein
VSELYVISPSIDRNDRLIEVQDQLRAEFEKRPEIADLIFEWLSLRFGVPRERLCQTK